MQSLRQGVLDYFGTLSNVDDTNHFVFRPPGEHAYFVKYSDDKDVLVESETQTYFYNLAQQNDSAPGIPKVYDVFRDSGRYFSVMEYVAGQTLETVSSEVVAISIATSAIRWLLSQELPSDAFGMVASSNSTCVRHHFFKDNRAPLAFANARALQAYVNKVWFYVDYFQNSFRVPSSGHIALPKA